MLIPSYMPDASRFDDEAVIAGLKEHNLFHVLQPETFLDNDSAMRLANAMTEIISSGVLDDLAKKDKGSVAEVVDVAHGVQCFGGVRERDLPLTEETGAREESKDGVSIPMNRSVPYIILIPLRRYFGATEGRRALTFFLPQTFRNWWVLCRSCLRRQRCRPQNMSFRSICRLSVWMSVQESAR
jgi:hypothetical protein